MQVPFAASIYAEYARKVGVNNEKKASKASGDENGQKMSKLLLFHLFPRQRIRQLCIGWIKNGIISLQISSWKTVESAIFLHLRFSFSFLFFGRKKTHNKLLSWFAAAAQWQIDKMHQLARGDCSPTKKKKGGMEWACMEAGAWVWLATATDWMGCSAGCLSCTTSISFNSNSKAKLEPLQKPYSDCSSAGRLFPMQPVYPFFIFFTWCRYSY